MHKSSDRQIMSKVLLGLTILLLTACSGDISTNANDNPNLTDHTVASAFMNGNRTFSVRTPIGYSKETERSYPVLFHIIDDADALTLTHGVIEDLSTNGQIPEMVIVSLHGTDSADYAPNNGEDQSISFLNYIENEVIPFVQSEYRTNGDMIMAGWSRFGIFTAYTFAKKPNLFKGYIVRSSSAYGSGGNDLKAIIRRDIEAHLSNTPSADRRFFFTLGSEETRRLDTFNQLMAVFENKAPASLKWKATIIEDAEHFDTYQAGLKDGLLFYFSDR